MVKKGSTQVTLIRDIKKEVYELRMALKQNLLSRIGTEDARSAISEIDVSNMEIFTVKQHLKKVEI